jgi:hypothetical protein
MKQTTNVTVVIFLHIWTLAAMHTGVVQKKYIACQADRFLLDGKKKKIHVLFSCFKATFY